MAIPKSFSEAAYREQIALRTATLRQRAMTRNQDERVIKEMMRGDYRGYAPQAETKTYRVQGKPTGRPLGTYTFNVRMSGSGPNRKIVSSQAGFRGPGGKLQIGRYVPPPKETVFKKRQWSTQRGGKVGYMTQSTETLKRWTKQSTYQGGEQFNPYQSIGDLNVLNAPGREPGQTVTISANNKIGQYIPRQSPQQIAATLGREATGSTVVDEKAQLGAKLGSYSQGGALAVATGGIGALPGYFAQKGVQEAVGQAYSSWTPQGSQGQIGKGLAQAATGYITSDPGSVGKGLYAAGSTATRALYSSLRTRSGGARTRGFSVSGVRTR